MFNRIVSVLFLTYMAATSLVFYALALVLYGATAWFDRRLVALHMFTSFWACLYIWSMPAWTLTVRGRHRIRRDTAYVIVSNHQSQLDILAAFGLFVPFKWVSKAEVFRLPFIGWNMRLNRYIPLRRGDRESILEMMRACERALAGGSSVYFFPEGTRSRTGRMKSFKTGAFTLARKLRKPVLPVAINGTHRALPKHSLILHGRHQLTVEVLPELAPRELAGLSDEEAAEKVRRLIAARVAEEAAPQCA